MVSLLKAITTNRKLSKKDKLAASDVARRVILDDLQELESRANAHGLFITGRALNQAKNACGWEIAGNLLAAGKASRGQRVKPEK